jgi:hypothetical protein
MGPRTLDASLEFSTTGGLGPYATCANVCSRAAGAHRRSARAARNKQLSRFRDFDRWHAVGDRLVNALKN